MYSIDKCHNLIGIKSNHVKTKMKNKNTRGGFKSTSGLINIRPSLKIMTIN